MKKIVLNAHPFLYTFVSLLFFYMQVRWETLPTEMLRPLLVLWLLNLALFPLLNKLSGSAEWAAILLTVFVLGFYYEKTVFTVVFLTTVVILLLVLLAFWLMKRRFQLFHLSLTLTVVSLVLVITESITVSKALGTIPASYYKSIASRQESLVIPLSVSNSDQLPDIYYIILDTYSSPDGLMEFYNYDNSEFVGYLEDLGFIVPRCAYSNYPRTALSVSSTLDMQYWDTIVPEMDEVVFWWPVKPILDHSRVRATLEAIGYQSISIASDWGLTNNTTTDLYYTPYPVLLSEYENYILHATPLGFLHAPFQNVLPVRTADVHRRFILYNLETLQTIPEIPGPKFVVSHIIIPHPPFVFDAQGEPVGSELDFTFGGPDDITKEEFRQGYLGHIEFLNSQLQILIESILETSDVEPIIILQADHGLNLYVNFNSAEDGCLKERFSTFAAYYFPGTRGQVLPENLTSVNIFRILFNEYFGAGLELLENRYFYTKGHNLFAGMEEVTDQALVPCVLPDD